MPYLAILLEVGCRVQTHLPDLSRHLIPHNPDAHNPSLYRQSEPSSESHPPNSADHGFFYSLFFTPTAPLSPGHTSSCLLISHLHFCSPNRYAGQLWLFKEAVQILPPQSPRHLLRSDLVHAPSLVQCMATFIHNDHSIVVIPSCVSPGHWL